MGLAPGPPARGADAAAEGPRRRGGVGGGEGLDEVAFSGIVRGQRTPLTKAKTIDLRVPAHAEFVFEGVVKPGVRRLEGPFGDHFGHYSHAADHPVFEITRVTRRKNAIYPATVVGRPPQEDRYLGDAAQLALTPLIRLLRREIRDMWAYYEAGFHNLLVVSVDPRYAREPIKTALGLFSVRVGGVRPKKATWVPSGDHDMSAPER